MHFPVQYLEDEAGQGKVEPELRPSKKGSMSCISVPCSSLDIQEPATEMAGKWGG